MLAAVLIAVALVPYPVTGATGTPPAAACRGGCQPGTMPSMVKWMATLPGTWVAAPGLTGTVPSSGLAYAATGGGVAAVGVGLAVYAYSATTGALEWQNTLSGFPAGRHRVRARLAGRGNRGRLLPARGPRPAASRGGHRHRRRCP